VKLVGLEMQLTIQTIGAVPSLVVYLAIPFIAPDMVVTEQAAINEMAQNKTNR